MKYTYEPQGTCSVQMDIDINEENDTINSVRIVKGCPGNTLGVSKLVEGRKVDEVISLLEGIPCGFRGTSCPDQLAKALKKYKENK
jgi:uncharacterized protein (TIGR03905 family)